MGIVSTLRNISPSLYRLRILAIIVTVLVLPFVLYYLIIVRSQTTYFTERSFRKLSLIGSQITSKVESVGLVLKNNSAKFINSNEFKPASEKEYVEKLKGDFAALQDDGPKIVPFDIEAVNDASQNPLSTISIAATTQENEGPKLFISVLPELEKPQPLVRVHAEVNLSELLQPLLTTRHYIGAERDQFHNVLISEAGTGKVIYQQDTREVQLASLDKLTSAADPAQKIDAKEIGVASGVVDVELAGSRYKLFSQPIEVANTTWIISGLIREDHFRTEVWSISYTVLIFCGFITALLILSWPFLKLFLIGPKDRLRTADVYFLTFAIIVTVAVFTVFGCYLYSYLKVERLMDVQLGQLSESVKKNFKDELTAALKQLDLLSNNCLLLRKLGSNVDCSTTRTDNIYTQDDISKTKILPEILDPQANPYPYFDTAVWIDDTGKQRAKWTIKNKTTQSISVDKRDYFSSLRRGDSYQLDGHQFWLEPIISKTTGRNEVEISMLTTDPKWIAAFDTRLISLMQPVLPAGFGYLIIGNDGKVLFHSDEAHHLGENFFQECDNDPELRSAVIGRREDPLNVRYVGEGHRLLVRKIESFPQWSLIVYRNKQPLRTAYLELLSLVSLLFLIYTIIIIAGFSAFYLVNVRNERRAWLWPCPQKHSVYLQSILVLLVLSLISALLIVWLHGEVLIGIIAAIGLLSTLAFFLTLRYAPSIKWPENWTIPAPLGWLGRHEVAYVLNLTIVILLISFFPAIAFFKYAYQAEMKSFIKHGQLTFASELAKREQRIRSQYVNIKTQADSKSGTSNNEPVLKPFATRRIGIPWDVYDSFFFKTSRSQANEHCPTEPREDVLAWLYWLLPLSDQTSVERRGVLATVDANGLGIWESGGLGLQTLHLDKKTIDESIWPERHFNTEVPGLGISGPVWLDLLLIGFLPTGFVLFFLFVHLLVRKIFLLDVYKPSNRPLSSFLGEKIKRNTFVVLDAPFVTKVPSSDSNLRLRDLRVVMSSPDSQEELKTAVAVAGEVLALDYFDTRSEDPEANQRKLCLLEKLLENDQPLLIFSTLEPSQYSFSNGKPEHENGNSDMAGRWARVMSRFLTEYAEDTGNPIAFKEEIEEERTRILSLERPDGPSDAEINQLIDTLRDECATKCLLQEVGLQILRQESFITLTKEHLLRRIINQARPYYVHLWNSCSPLEQVTLSHLAKDRLLSHRDPDIQRLLRRELIVRDQDVHLMNDSFREFIASMEEIDFVSEEESKAKKVSPWHTLKGPIFIVLVAVTIFLFTTQRDIYMSSLAILTAITTLIPALFKVLHVFHSDQFSPRPSPE